MTLALLPLARSDGLVEKVVATLRQRIMSGQLEPGARLPSEHQLSASLSVSRSVVREGISRLKADGFVASRQGAGLFVAERPGTGSFRLEAANVGVPTSRRHVLELRLIVEVAAAGLAAERRTASDLAALGAASSAMHQAIVDARDGSAHDDAFHRAIAAATHNPDLERFVGFLGAAFADTRLPSWMPSAMAAGLADAAQAEHELILAAIEQGDVAKAKLAAEDHLRRSARRTGILPDDRPLSTPEAR